MSNDPQDFEEIRAQFEARVEKLGEADVSTDPPTKELEPETNEEPQPKPEGTDEEESISKGVGGTSSPSDEVERFPVQADEPDFIPSVPDVTPVGKLSDYEELEPIEAEEGHLHLTDVYKAKLPDGPHVALKQPNDKAEGTENLEIGEGLLEEAEMLEQVDSANHIVSLIDSGYYIDDHRPYLVMEYMDGGSLEERLGQMPIEQAIWTGMCIAHGVFSANKFNIEHGDIKPVNILFREVDDGWDVPKVADWGEARIKTQIDDTKALSYPYASPEQHIERDEDIARSLDIPLDKYKTDDARDTDQYQLALTLYELIADDNPYRRPSKHTIQAKIDADFEQLSARVDEVPEALDPVIEKALSPNPRDRYNQILDFMEALAAVYDEVVDHDVSTRAIKYPRWTINTGGSNQD